MRAVQNPSVCRCVCVCVWCVVCGVCVCVCVCLYVYVVCVRVCDWVGEREILCVCVSFSLTWAGKNMSALLRQKLCAHQRQPGWKRATKMRVLRHHILFARHIENTLVRGGVENTFYRLQMRVLRHHILFARLCA